MAHIVGKLCTTPAGSETWDGATGYLSKSGVGYERRRCYREQPSQLGFRYSQRVDERFQFLIMATLLVVQWDRFIG